VADYKEPGFLALHPQKPILYSIGAPNTAFADRSGSVAGFAIGADHGLSFLGEASCGGRGPCHLQADRTGKFLAVANYADGSVATVALDAKGAPSGDPQVQQNGGSGPTARQKGPHAHGAYFNAANDRLMVPDLGADKLLVYRFDAATGALTADTPAATAPGAGPRHLALHPKLPFAYVINELDNTVGVYQYTDDQASFTPVETQPTLPDDFKGTNTTAEIEIHPNGKFLFASNRGHDSIAAWSIDQTSGMLALVGREPSGGKTPRHFAVSPGGHFLLAANQASGDIQVLAINPQTGALSTTPHKTHVPGPICLLFLTR
jgi:6-phosphogluconolactonase